MKLKFLIRRGDCDKPQLLLLKKDMSQLPGDVLDEMQSQLHEDCQKIIRTFVGKLKNQEIYSDVWAEVGSVAVSRFYMSAIVSHFDIKNVDNFLLLVHSNYTTYEVRTKEIWCCLVYTVLEGAAVASDARL